MRGWDCVVKNVDSVSHPTLPMLSALYFISFFCNGQWSYTGCSLKCSGECFCEVISIS